MRRLILIGVLLVAPAFLAHDLARVASHGSSAPWGSTASTDRGDLAAPLTEIEQLRIENARLEGLVLQAQIETWTAKRNKLKADLELARPGWIWNPETAQFTKKETK